MPLHTLSAEPADNVSTPAKTRFPIAVRLDTFEGPLDLLLFLIQSRELDISRISLSRITRQYLDYVQAIQELDFEHAGDFLVMASTLVYWKSKTILPSSDQQPTPEGTDPDVLTPEELIRRLLERRRFRAAGQSLLELPRLGEDVFVRPNRRPPVIRALQAKTRDDLVQAYWDAHIQARLRQQVLRKETVSIAEKIQEIGQSLRVGLPTEISHFIESSTEAEGTLRAEVVATFLATLELTRLSKIRVHQDRTYGPILLEALEELLGIELKLSSEFDSAVNEVLENPA